MVKHYEPPEDRAGTVFDPTDETFGPIMAAIQAGDFEQAGLLLDRLGPAEVPPAGRVTASAVVNANLDTEVVPVADATVAELLTVCIGRARDRSEMAEFVAEDRPVPVSAGSIRREYALAITHMEDALTRFNKATYRENDTFAITDAERS